MDPVAAQLLNWQPRQQGMAMNTQSMQAEQQMQQMRVLQMQQMQAQQQAQQRALAARAPAFGVLEQMGQQPQPQVPPPPSMMPPSPAAPPPGSMSPGGGNPQVMPPGGAPGQVPPPPQAGPPAAAAPPQPGPPPPFRPMPTAGPGGGGPGQVPPPPAQAPQSQEVVAPPHIDIRKAIEQISKTVPPEQRMEVLDQLMPVVQAAQRDELNFFRAQTGAQTAAIRAYQAEIAAYKATTDNERKTRDTEVREEAERRRREQGDERIAIAKRALEGKLKRQAGTGAGGAALKSTEFIYPKGADGKPDQSQEPIGVRGVTKTGKIINIDAEGNPVSGQQGGGTAKEAKVSGGNQQAAVRANLVRSGVTNAINRLDEIEKVHPGQHTSEFFGHSGDNPLSRGVYGRLSAAQGEKQQDVDAKWAAFIDEAIPVFTGGLRGSDAFRRFLIEQAPGPGAKPALVKEKMRLFRENINGTNKAFFEKFKADPKMWAPGTKPEDLQGGASRETPGGAGQYKEGQTATGPGGKKVVFRDGQWQPVQ